MNTWCTAHRAPCMRRRILASSPIAREEASEQALVAQRRAELGRVCGSGSQAAVRLQHPLRQHDAGVKHFEQRLAGIQAPGLARCAALFQARRSRGPQRHAAPGA